MFLKLPLRIINQTNIGNGLKAKTIFPMRPNFFECKFFFFSLKSESNGSSGYSQSCSRLKLASANRRLYGRF